MRENLLQRRHHRRQKAMPAMTGIAVIAGICASASEDALLVASLMPISLDLGVTHRRAESVG
jgi:hypothetical protein